MALMPYDQSPYKIEKFGDRHTEEESCMRNKGRNGMMFLQAKDCQQTVRNKGRGTREIIFTAFRKL